MKILNAVRAAIARHLHVDAMSIEPNHLLEKNLGMDPLDIALVIMRLESLCDVDIPTERAERVRTVEDIEMCVRDQVDVQARSHGARRPFVVDSVTNAAHATRDSHAGHVDRARTSTRRAMRRTLSSRRARG